MILSGENIFAVEVELYTLVCEFILPKKVTPALGGFKNTNLPLVIV
jgi:hypothetical protein